MFKVFIFKNLYDFKQKGECVRFRTVGAEAIVPGAWSPHTAELLVCLIYHQEMKHKL